MSTVRQKMLDGQMPTDHKELERCYEQIKRLIVENHDLRRSSECFADLAERLNRQLLAERDGVPCSKPRGSN
jgi:hypothetical protein